MKTKTILTAGSVFLVAAVLSGAASFLLAPSPVCAANVQVSFKEDVYPIFKGRCVDCHRPGGSGLEASGLDLTTYAGLMKGTKFGPMIVPGDPDVSNLMRLLDWKASPALRMPHGKKKLSTCDRDAIRTWIRQGAKDN
jgi:mono/diheme cytochrome c family protein